MDGPILEFFQANLSISYYYWAPTLIATLCWLFRILKARAGKMLFQFLQSMFVSESPSTKDENELRAIAALGPRGVDCMILEEPTSHGPNPVLTLQVSEFSLEVAFQWALTILKFFTFICNKGALLSG